MSTSINPSIRPSVHTEYIIRTYIHSYKCNHNENNYGIETAENTNKLSIFIYILLCFVWYFYSDKSTRFWTYLLGAQDSSGLAPNIETTGPWQGLKGHKAQTFGFFAHDLKVWRSYLDISRLGFQSFGFRTTRCPYMS